MYEMLCHDRGKVPKRVQTLKTSPERVLREIYAANRYKVALLHSATPVGTQAAR